MVAPIYAKRDDADATKRNISYFLSFNDPTQPEHEVGSILVALILTAMLEMKRAGRVDTTPSQVVSYMVARAEASPQDMRLFLQIKYFGVLLLFRKAERCNKLDLYFTCMRLSLPLLAVENAYNYVHIFTELLKYWATCSEAEEDLIRKYGFTLETPNGAFVGIDYGHEKYVRLVRDSTGKVKRKANKAKIEHAALCRMSQQHTEGIKERKKIKGKDLKRYDGRVLAKTMITLSNMGAWSEKLEEKQREPDTDAVYSMEHIGERVPTEILHTDSIGEALVIQYTKKLSCLEKPPASREKTGLSKRDYTVEGSKEKHKRLVALATSTVVKTVSASGDKAELTEELQYLRSHVSQQDFPDVTKLKTKPDLAKALVDVRKAAFKENQGLIDECTKRAEDKAYGGKSTSGDRRQELQRRFFASTVDNPELTSNYRIEL
jgi:hypothetical protein